MLRWAILLALLPLVSSAQLLPVSNVVIRGGIAPGYTELQTNGMIRWNQSLLIHEGWNGTEWAPIAGSGSGFPLTNNVLANVSNTTFGVSDFGFIGFTGSTNNLFHDGTNLMFGDRVVGTIDPGVFEVDFFGGLMPKDISIVVTDDLFEYDGAGSIMPKDS